MKVRHRLLWLMCLTTLTGATLVAGGAIWLIRSAVQENFVSRIEAETRLLASQAADLQAGEAQLFAGRAAGDLGLRVTLIAADGAVLGDSARQAGEVVKMDNHSGRPEIEAARVAGSGVSFRTSNTTQVEYFYSARRLDSRGAIGYIRIALPSSEVHRVQWQYGAWVVGVALGTAALVALAAFFLVRRVTDPVERMTNAVERAAQGEARLALPHGGPEEVARLGAAVRQMQQALLEKLVELDAERRLFSSVVSGMQEGLLLVTPDHRVRLANDAFRKAFRVSIDPTGHLLAEVARDPRILSDVQTVLDTGEEVHHQIIRLDPGLAFQLHSTPLGPAGGGAPEGVLVLMVDITRLERLESVRREFVANVSHELRTPLTAIKAFVETLVDGGLDDRENARRFLGIIDRHADRMGALIEDLTHLSLIETGVVELEFRELRPAEVISELVEPFRRLAASRQIDVTLDLDSELSLRADRRSLEQMLSNLLDNAMKYSEPGAEITVSASRVGQRPVLAVRDTGLGITLEDQRKIFNRFFQVDKARSRKAGGTGLGLAIVKHLMRLHGGTVRVASELGQGSSFFLEFPADDQLAGG